MLYFIGIGICLFFGIWGILALRRGSLDALESVHWDQVPVDIQKCELRVGKNEHRATTYNLDLRYSYVINEKEYHSKVCAFYFPESGTDKTYYDAIMAKISSVSVCYVNPQNPKKAVLIPGITRETPQIIKYMLPIATVMMILCPIAGWTAIYILFIK